jgi:hypothetical protein
MLRRVRRISIWQATKFCTVLYFLIGLVFGLIFGLAAVFAPPEQAGLSVGFAIAFPFIYAISGLIFVPLGCLIFNGVSRLVGGLEFEVVDRGTNPA